MREKALNKIAGFPFPCLIGKLYLPANIQPNNLVDKWVEESKVTAASKIKDVANHLFGAKSGSVGPVAVVPHILVEMT